MNAGAKLSAYGLVLAAALGSGATLGAAAGPIDIGDAPVHGEHDPDPTPARSPSVTGLSITEGGYRIVAGDRLADAGEFAFTIVDETGDSVTEFDVEHTKRLHLIVASRELRSFHHLHPEMDDAGRWSIDLPSLAPGAYRAFADIHPTGGDAVTLGVDLTAPGAVDAPAILTPTSSSEVDGYSVHLTGDIEPGDSSTVAVTVTRDGQTVTTDPYLGARGHLVALRDGDLAYLHVHPLPDAGDGAVRFAVEVPSDGTYALFFDFAHDDAVHTARFVIDADAPPATAPPTIGQPTTDQPATHADDDAGHARN